VLLAVPRSKYLGSDFHAGIHVHYETRVMRKLVYCSNKDFLFEIRNQKDFDELLTEDSCFDVTGVYRFEKRYAQQIEEKYDVSNADVRGGCSIVDTLVRSRII